MEANRFFYGMIKCEACQICESSSDFLKEFKHWANETRPEDFLSSCLSYTPSSGHCENVCSSIASQNCNKYPSFCQCKAHLPEEKYCCHRHSGRDCLSIEGMFLKAKSFHHKSGCVNVVIV